MLQTTAIPTPAKNPIPWITRDLREAGLFKTKTFDGQKAARLLQILTTAVAALHDDGHPYRVVFTSGGTAATDLQNRIVQVSTAVMLEPDLSDGQKAAVLLGLVLHEVGHIRYHRDVVHYVRDAFGSQTRAIHAISNIAADLHDEGLARQAFPGAAKAVDVTLWYVSGMGKESKRSATNALVDQGYAGRVNLLVGATRYPWGTNWDGPGALDFFKWAQAWGRRCERSDTGPQHVARIREALAYIGQPPTPTPEGPTCGPEGPTGEKPEGPTQPGEGKGKGKGEPTDEKGEKPEGGEGGDDEPGEDEGPEGPTGKGEGKGEGGDTDEGDEPGEDEGPTGDPGSLSGEGTPRDPMAEDDMRIDTTTCTSEKAREKRTGEDRTRDQVLQNEVDNWERAQRTGRNVRTYNHPGRPGLKVTRRPWIEGKGWDDPSF